nr:hypothetical protein [Chlorobaculum limnaeum]
MNMTKKPFDFPVWYERFVAENAIVFQCSQENVLVEVVRPDADMAAFKCVSHLCPEISHVSFGKFLLRYVLHKEQQFSDFSVGIKNRIDRSAPAGIVYLIVEGIMFARPQHFISLVLTVSDDFRGGVGFGK